MSLAAVFPMGLPCYGFAMMNHPRKALGTLLAMLAMSMLVQACVADAPQPAPNKGRKSSDPLGQYLAHPKVLLLDVRTPAEFAAGHIPGALNIPLSRVKEAAALLKKNPGRPTIAYCRTGSRSGIATRLLHAQGIERVVNGGGYRQLAARMKVVLVKGPR